MDHEPTLAELVGGQLDGLVLSTGPDEWRIVIELVPAESMVGPTLVYRRTDRISAEGAAIFEVEPVK